jgi:hypothetical protein
VCVIARLCERCSFFSISRSGDYGQRTVSFDATRTKLTSLKLL